MSDLRYSDRFWTKWYRMLGLPESLPDPQCSIIEATYRVWSEKVPRDKVALVCGGYEMTAKEMIDNVDRMVSVFRGFGLEKGDCVATLIGNGIQLSFGMMGILCSNLTWQPISMLQKAPELERQLRESGARTIICYDEHLDLVDSIKEKTALENIIVTSRTDFTAVQQASVSEEPGTCQLRNLLTSHEPATPVFNLQKDDTALLIFTGGATGVPKGVELSLGNANFFEQILTGLLGPLTETVTGKLAMAIVQHMFHIGIATWLIGMRLGCTMYLVHDPRDVRTIFNYLTKPGVYFALYAPGQIARMAELDDLDMSKIGHVLSLSGMASLSPELGEKYRKKTGVSPFQAYGQTESTALITLNLPAMISTLGLGSVLASPRARKVMSTVMPFVTPRILKLLSLYIRLVGAERLWGSSRHRIMDFLMKRGGRKRTTEGIKKDIGSIGIPMWNTDVKLVDLEDRKTLVPVGQVGELCFKGPQRMKGYLETEGDYSGPGYDEEGFVHTGDAAYMDGDGLIYLVDRTKDMINVSGFKVYGTTVENVVYEHTAVAMCAAFAVADDRDPSNERVKLVVQLKKEISGIDRVEKEILELCDEKLAPYAKPRYIEFMDEIPMMHTEKVDKLLLREREASRGSEASSEPSL